MDKITNIIITGVGGQGILLASEIISESAVLAGYDVKRSEIHGMAQRGGSVNSHIRFGKKIYSPLVMKGECDLLLAFEKLEAIRMADFINKEGTIIVNDQQINPVPVSSGSAVYPENIEEILKKYFPSVIFVNAFELAKQAGNVRTANIALLGVASKKLNIPIDVWEKVIVERVPQRAIEVNLKAFHLGLQST
ncbi:TPA: indolepyruvate oxidoreductase subunit beta [Candidatus Poribacteria bacterium]|nr:indolepyruvate oxidoreductase subunit beta [Candidatus Poribacteria bacterium]